MTANTHWKYFYFKQTESSKIPHIRALMARPSNWKIILKRYDTSEAQYEEEAAGNKYKLRGGLVGTDAEIASLFNDDSKFTGDDPGYTRKELKDKIAELQKGGNRNTKAIELLKSKTFTDLTKTPSTTGGAGGIFKVGYVERADCWMERKKDLLERIKAEREKMKKKLRAQKRQMKKERELEETSKNGPGAKSTKSESQRNSILGKCNFLGMRDTAKSSSAE